MPRAGAAPPSAADKERPHSKLGWMTPRGYASALNGEAGRDAALRWGSAPRPLATHETEGSNQPRTLLSTGRKSGVTSGLTPVGARSTVVSVMDDPARSGRTPCQPTATRRDVTVLRDRWLTLSTSRVNRLYYTTGRRWFSSAPKTKKAQSIWRQCRRHFGWDGDVFSASPLCRRRHRTRCARENASSTCHRLSRRVRSIGWR